MNSMNKILFCVFSSVVLLLMAGCSEVDTLMPPGERGERGADGLDAYALWKEALAGGQIADWDADKNTEADFAKYLQGRDGRNGADGKDGRTGESAFETWVRMVKSGQVDNPHSTAEPKEKWPTDHVSMRDFWFFLIGASGEAGQIPHIGSNGHWFVGTEDTGVPARGEKGDTGKAAQPPVIGINDAGNWTINGVSTGVRAAAIDGKGGRTLSNSVSINDAGFWVIDGKVTDVKAKAEDGVPVVVTIENGMWKIGTTSTGIPAFGTKGEPGDDGADGRSAYQLWTEYIKDGTADDPHHPGEKWPAGKNSLADFWEFLSDFNSGSAEDDAMYVIAPQVAHTFTDGSVEYVNRDNGGVLYRIYRNGEAVGAGFEVSGLPGLLNNWGPDPADADLSFTTDANGEFTIPAYNLPNHADESTRKGEASVKAPGASSAVKSNPVLVYNRVNVRVTINKVYLASYSNFLMLQATVERETGDGNWTNRFPVSERMPYKELIAWYLSFKVKDPSRPLSADNLDLSEMKKDRSEWRWFNQAYNAYDPEESKSIVLKRPISLDEDEKASTGEDKDFKENIYPYRWDGEANYVGVVNRDYGNTWVASEKVLVPEVYSALKLKSGTLYIDDTKPDNCIIWGEVDENSFNPFYLTEGSTYKKDAADEGRYTDDDILFVKDGDSWIPNPAYHTDGGKINGDRTKLGKTSLMIFKVKGGQGNRTHYFKRQPAFDVWNFRFKIDKTIPGCLISTYTSNGSSSQGNSTNEYRERVVYRLEKGRDGSYSLRNPYNDEILPLIKGTYQEGWENQ